ncbi:MAG: hypothetical protein AAGN66_23980 [Acidobacteriota bacterium]
MRLDVLVHTSEDHPTPGEISTEISGAEGEPIFVPWCTTPEFVQGRPYPLAGFSGDLETPVRIQLVHPKQLPLTEALRVPRNRVVFEKPPQPPKGQRRRTLSLNMGYQQYEALRVLAKRDRLAVAAWIRSLVERELHFRRL